MMRSAVGFLRGGAVLALSVATAFHATSFRAGAFHAGDDEESAAVEWVRERAVPLDSVEPGYDLADLDPLWDLVGDARIVSLGEGTHGTREFFQVRHRLVEFLVQEMGFTEFAIEAGYADARLADRYVMGEEVDVEEALDALLFWIWRTEGLRDLLDWMRDYNQDADEPVRFRGMDAQVPSTAMNQVTSYLRTVDPPYSAQVGARYATLFGDEVRAPPRPGEDYSCVVANAPMLPSSPVTLRLTASLRTESLTDGVAGLWLQIDDEVIDFDSATHCRVLRGDHEWTELSLVREVGLGPKSARFGAFLTGDGITWLDDLRFSINGEEYRSYGYDPDFERPLPLGFFRHAPTATIELDRDVRVRGRQSLRISTLHRTAEPAADDREAIQRCVDLAAELEERRERYVPASSSDEFEWALRCARQVVRCMRSSRQGGRDREMAGVVGDILADAGSDARVILWGHNNHVIRLRGMMGHYLDQDHGEDQVVIALTTHRGTYTAARGRELPANDLVPSPSGSAESIFAASGVPAFLLDVRDAFSDEPGAAWLTRPTPFRSLGSIAMPQQFQDRRLKEVTDLVLFVDQTSASRLIPR